MFSLFPQESPWCQWFSANPSPRFALRSWYELIPRWWARINVFLGKKKKKRNVPSHQHSPCHECSCGAQWGSLCEGAGIVPGEGHPRLQPRSELSLRSPALLSIPSSNGLPQPTKSHCTKPSKSSWAGRNLVNKGTTPGSLTRLWESGNLLDFFGQHSKIQEGFQVVASGQPQSRVGFNPFFLPLPLKNSFQQWYKVWRSWLVKNLPIQSAVGKDSQGQPLFQDTHRSDVDGSHSPQLDPWHGN